VQGAGQVAGDGGQAVVYLADLAAYLHQFLISLDTRQGCRLGFGVGADILPPP